MGVTISDKPAHEICTECGKEAPWYLRSPEEESMGPFCEECSIDKVFEYSGWERYSVDELK